MTDANDFITTVFNGSGELTSPEGLGAKNTYKLKWDNKLAIQRVYQIAEVSGPPSSIDASARGTAVWNWPN